MNDPATAICQHCAQRVHVVGARLRIHSRPDGSACRDSGRPVAIGETVEEGTVFIAGPSSCPPWCSSDHPAQIKAELERIRQTAERTGHVPPFDEFVVHDHQIGAVGDVRVIVEQETDRATGEASLAMVAVLGSAEDISPADARQLAQLLIEASTLIET